MKLTHIRLLVADYDSCFRFYRDVMGFQPVWGAEGEGYADFKTEGDAILAVCERGIVSSALGTEHLPSPDNTQDRAMLIFGVDDLHATAAQLRERGAEFVGEPTDHPDWGIRTAHLRDPDGTLIEINSPMPHEEWTEQLQEESRKYT